MNKMSLEVGQMAPDFEAKIETGASIKLSDYRGKKVILYFYPKDATPGCTAQACNLRDNYEQLLNAGYVIFGVSSDTEKSHQKFIEKQNLPFSLIADTDLTVHHAYGTWIEKSMYGRAYKGTARTTFVIDEAGKLAEIIEKVDTKNHTAQVLK
jgi:peroxiredoxin Q/BCP